MQAHAQRWIFIAIIYFIIGVLLGLGMGIFNDHRLYGAHAHINLLGWLSMVATGVIYHFFPNAGQSRLATIHFWFYNIGLPAMMIGLAGKLLGHEAMEPVLGIGSLLVGIGVLLFGINVLSKRS